MIGSLVAGRYRLDARIGEGGVALVYKALDITLEREVAVKILRPEMASNEEVVARFRREAHAAAKLNHPNIVQIYDTGVDEDIYYIVMEYLPEPDLKRIIKEYAPLPLRKVLEVTIQCARALAYAHKQGLVHRDVKPHNILFTDDGRVKLSDFGIAAATGDSGLTDSGLVLGTAYYVSPEQAQGAPATVQSDIYSLGVVMFECITGRPPFTGSSAAEIAAKHVRERPPSLRALNPNITPSAEFVINKAMARETPRRYRGADELLVDLEKLADGVDLDRTGVLGPISDEVTMRLAPTQMPPTVAEPPRPVHVPSPAPTRTAPTTGARAVPERNPGSVAAATALAVIIAIMALLGVGWLVTKAFYPGTTARKVEVPSVKGLSQAEAQKLIEARGLHVGKVSFEEDDTAPEGTVLQQVPDIGEQVEAGTAVALVISRSKQMVTVPNVLERTEAEARDRLTADKLQVGVVDSIFHERIPKGQVVKQEPAGGNKVNAGTDVNLTLSKGPEPKPATVEEQPAEGAGEGQAPDNPQVRIREDTSRGNEKANERRLIVNVIAQGNQRGQKIQIIKSDDTATGQVVQELTLDPGASRDIPVTIVGDATIQVYYNDAEVFSDDYSAGGTGH
ncbi:MAG: Stk1 family PASTA domain-containing Ser/Thr kinase [Armatimonadia bacterium]